jgi:hypothetical protein
VPALELHPRGLFGLRDPGTAGTSFAKKCGDCILHLNPHERVILPNTTQRAVRVGRGALAGFEVASHDIPYGVSIGNDKTPVGVHVGFRDGQLTEIDVTFNTNYWNEVVPILDQKYGADWVVERHDDVVIDMETKQRTKIEGIALTHRTHGLNPKSGDACEIWANNYDLRFQHHDPMGAYHSVFVVKLISKNF